ncbi:NlpC/P60 family protein [Maricaulis sp. CAU 1757]
MNTRTAALREARRWIGTPYRWQASCRGAGTDCLGLVRGVWRSLHGAEPPELADWQRDWETGQRREALLDGCQRWLEEIDKDGARPGDVMLFRPDRKGPAKHCGIVAPHDHIVHAYWGRAVAETALHAWWQRRRVAAFRFPRAAIESVGGKAWPNW